MTRPSASHVRAARRPLAAGVALMAALALSACSSSTPAAPASSGAAPASSAAAASKPLRIGFSPFTLQVPALKGLADALTGVAKGQGDSVLVADPKLDPSVQLQQINQWVKLGQIDALWVIPQSAKALTSAITAAQAKGIVIIASGVPADYGFSGPQKGITFTNVDNAAFGKALGEQTAKCITDKLAGTGNVVFLQSPQGQQSSSAINTSFKSALAAGAPDAKIVNTQFAKDRLGSQQEVSSALQGNPDANVMVGTDDESTLGGLSAFNSAGKTDAKICVVGAGGNDEAQADVKKGTLYADIAFDFQTDLVQNLKALHTLAANPSANGVQLVTPIKTIVK